MNVIKPIPQVLIDSDSSRIIAVREAIAPFPYYVFPFLMNAPS